MLPTPIRLIETAAPGAEPVTLDEAKAQLREGNDDDDALIRALIAAARQAAERFTGRALITRGYSLYLDVWPEEGAVALPYPPLVSVSSVQVYADDDAALEFPAGSYFADRASMPGRVALRAGIMPPCPGRGTNGIEIRYRAGYGAAPSDVPELLRHGILRLIAHLYQHRGDDGDSLIESAGSAALLRPYRILGL
jgi:uncharacterized phiE125 gp8 family phage protein